MDVSTNPRLPVKNLQRVVVTGIRGSIEKSLQVKQQSNEIVEVVSCESGAPGLRHLNSTVAAGRGTVNMATGRLVVEARALAA